MLIKPAANQALFCQLSPLSRVDGSFSRLLRRSDSTGFNGSSWQRHGEESFFKMTRGKPAIIWLYDTQAKLPRLYFKCIDRGVTILLMKGYTLREAAQALGVSVVTIRRYIKSGKLKARLVPSKFGESYLIEDLPMLSKPLSDNTLSTQPLINRIELLSQEVGYWKAKAEWLQERLLLLEAPKQTHKQRWWQRLFRPWH